MKLFAVYPTCLLVVCQLAALCQNVLTDPCAPTNHKPIPDINRRDERNELSNGEISINDMEIEEGWYGMSTYTLLTHAPGFFKCGGWYPMWIKEVVQGQATVCHRTEDNECKYPFRIGVKNCAGFTVYYLIAAPVYKASYCFERDLRDPPLFKAIPTVTIHLEKPPSQIKSELFFECGFSPDQDQVLFYQISWYVNGNSILTHTASNQMSGKRVSNTQLTEKNLLDKGFKAGINIQCGLRAMFGPDQAPGENGLSAAVFVGIKLLQATEIAVNHGESASIDMMLTAPFGCGSIGGCSLPVVAVISVIRPNGGCPASAVSKACGIDPFNTGPAGQRRTIEVFGVVTDTYAQLSDRDTISSINLMVPIMPSSPFWSNYLVGTVQVRVRRNTQVIEQKSCSLENDPWLIGFSFSRWNYVGQTGIFTLYKHQSEPIEVQVEIRRCTTYIDQTCTCGLAVRVGKTVFVVSKCNSKVWTREFTQCDTTGEVMQVRRREGNQYDIHLPTGARLELTLDIYNSLLNVKIYPSVRDVDKTLGMCGTLSSSTNNVMIKRSGQTTTSVDELVESWRVPVLEDLFDEDNIKRLRDTYTTVQQYCTCEGTRGNERLTCSPMSGTQGCGPVRTSSVVKPNVQCTISKRRKRMALMGSATSRRKREALPVLNEEEARNFCNQLFGKSETVDICQTVPGVNVNGSKEECVRDIMGSKTTVFSNMALSSVRDSCFHEVAVNPSLTEPDPEAPMSPPVAMMVTALSCSNDCSGQGTCIDGACVCEAGYGGADCSVDLNQPPDLYTAEDGGHCDLATSSCEELAVYGEVFTGSPNASCRIEKYVVYGDGTTGNRNMLTTVARDEGINEAVCELPKRVKRQAVQTNNEVTAYNITITNTGKLYSNGVVLLVYDSTCISINERTRQWTIQGAYCMYNSKCIPESSPRPDSSCLVCEVAGNQRSWIYSTECVKNKSGAPFTWKALKETVSLEALKPPVSGGALKPPVSLEAMKPPVSWGALKPPVSLEAMKPPVSRETLKQPVSQRP